MCAGIGGAMCRTGVRCVRCGGGLGCSALCVFEACRGMFGGVGSRGGTGGRISGRARAPGLFCEAARGTPLVRFPVSIGEAAGQDGAGPSRAEPSQVRAARRGSRLSCALPDPRLRSPAPRSCPGRQRLAAAAAYAPNPQ